MQAQALELGLQLPSGPEASASGAPPGSRALVQVAVVLLQLLVLEQQAVQAQALLPQELEVPAELPAASGLPVQAPLAVARQQPLHLLLPHQAL